MKKKNLLLTAIAIFGLATITMAQVPSYVPTNGLVGWWPFNGNANDESGNGNNGTVYGTTSTNDRFGNPNSAYSFDGVDDFIEVANNPSVTLLGDLSMSAWVKTNGYNNQNYQTIISKRETYWTWEYAMMLSYHNGIVHDTKLIGSKALAMGNQEQVWSNDSYSATIWEFWTVVFESGNMKIYKNGMLDTSASFSLIPNQQNCPLLFGRNSLSDLSEQFFGSLDDIGIWNRALTQQEITDVYNGCQLAVNTQPANQTININNNAQFVVGSSDPGASYQWQTDLGVGFQNLSNAGQYSGVTTGTLTVSNVSMSNNNQNFRCIVTSGSCSDTSNVAVLTVNNNVGINETSQDNLFSVFPNPAQSIINVKADSKLIGSVYSIYDNTGRVVLTGKLNSENTTIELGNLSGGIYMFNIGENMKQSFKVIKE